MTEVVGGVSYGLAGLHVKGMIMGKLLGVSRNSLFLGSTVSPWSASIRRYQCIIKYRKTRLTEEPYGKPRSFPVSVSQIHCKDSLNVDALCTLCYNTSIF